MLYTLFITKELFLCVCFIFLTCIIYIFHYYLYDISVTTMCIYRDYFAYHYKSTELVSLYTLDIELIIFI